jgi:hypothetical protein
MGFDGLRQQGAVNKNLREEFSIFRSGACILVDGWAMLD